MAPVLDQALAERGEMPLPPYIAGRRAADDRDRTDYQTMFARAEGSVAAPTAGLHFTESLVAALSARGIDLHRVTLHVGPGTFLPVKAEDTSAHRMQPEWGSLSAETAAALNATRRAGGRIVAVGSTSLRLLESAAAADGTLAAFSGKTALFITPGYRFRAVEAMLTNFHLPRSTLFMLVCAFCGLDVMRRAYAHAIEAGYRFYSYGDACLLFPMHLARHARPVLLPPHCRRRRRPRRRNDDGARHRAHAGLHAGRHARCGQGRASRRPACSGHRILLANTYHLMLRPGAERVAALGGLHAFMRWPYPILTDSGGFQVMSLAPLREVTERGVTFRSHLDGAMVELTPERAIEVQILLGSDIAMQLDECVKLPADHRDIERAMKLSLRWAERCKRAFEGRARRAARCSASCRAATIKNCAQESVRALAGLGFDGYAIGGLAVGESPGRDARNG